MKRPAIFFDRDNTLIVCDGYLGDPEKVELMEGAAAAVAHARLLGFATVTISNQSGVARGMFDEAAVHAVNRRVDQALKEANSSAVIDRHEFCPYHPDATVEEYKKESDLRKPKPGMILSAAEKLALDLSRSWVIGDAPRDVQAGQAAGCRTILLHQPDVKASPAASEQLSSHPDYVAANLKEAMDFIERNINADSGASQSNPPSAERAKPEPARVQPIESRLENLAEQILQELRKRNQESDYSDFSVSKLMAGIVQVLALAVLFISYLNRGDPSFGMLMLSAIFLQILTISLLIMGRQK